MSAYACSRGPEPVDSVTFVTAPSPDIVDQKLAVATPRVALVTGASKGIGRAIAERLVGAGHRVAATYRTGDVPAGVLGVQCDVTDPGQVDAAFGQVESALGTVDILVANAGITRDTLLMRMTDADWDAVIATNLTGAFRVARRAARPMIKKRFGRIIFISSVVGLLGSAGQVNYAASKSGLVGLARSLARELGSRGVTANVVAPGFIETDMTAELGEDLTTKYAAQIPLGRMGEVDDIASTIEFLASDGAGYITGALIPVDGGLGMGH
jgi:3-oxoacyl-[acyl-carrier protein] reductase